MLFLLTVHESSSMFFYSELLEWFQMLMTPTISTSKISDGMEMITLYVKEEQRQKPTVQT